MSRKHRHKLNGIERYYLVLICNTLFHEERDTSQMHEKMKMLQ